ncbi:arginine--tRNA ligase [Exilibacterium tricleocarpae]|uniref:Arginine--tRNA ligase n=1 Tax=Exilibacterium tricleocarpae TaxID=2591008 RepID=A0A545U5F9_9GAMM|nr:arginine--tRNA ligase [Exilibacterium tricleocarpae]TQV84643.1 arginine--tRNA ligase [Exilibacterium tricleocarpae]
MNIRKLLSAKVQAAMAAVGIPPACAAQVVPSKKPGFGDYQANGAMGAAKAMKTNPRELAQAIVGQLSQVRALEDIAEKVEIAGPGFINIHLAPAWLGQQAGQVLAAARLGIDAQQPQTVIVDYSSPNLAKEMHVGHLRSTIIGDAQARILEFLGHRVIRQNHVGDWGTQFGMLIAELEEHLGSGEAADFALQDLETFYRQAKQHFDSDPDFADRARDYVVKLQAGDTDILALWQQFREVSLHHSEAIYRRLNVTLARDHVCGESAYNADLPVLLEDLQQRGLVIEDQGAQVMFLPELADKEGNPCPVIMQKRGGGYLYATTDMAAMRHRVTTLKADRILYFIDARQSLHMQQVFAAARRAGYVGEQVSLEHHAFGTMMGEDGTPFKTRSGDTVKLAGLLAEAEQRAAALLSGKASELTPAEQAEVSRKVGIGAVKYADLSKTRTHDYIFSWDAMLSMDGNTAPYLQYAYTRVKSIFRNAGVDPASLAGDIVVSAPAETALVLKLLQFSEAVEQVAREAYPHILCTYLYEVASLYMRFYEACPILKEGVDEKTRASRLRLCDLVAQTLNTGLDLLGIETMERM